MLRMGNSITMQGVRSLYVSAMDGLKLETLDKGIINQAGIDIMSIIIIVSFVFQALSLKSDLILVSKPEKKLTDKIQFLKRPTNETTTTKTYSDTEAFRAEPNIPFHYETEEEWLKVIRKPTLIYPAPI